MLGLHVRRTHDGVALVDECESARDAGGRVRVAGGGVDGDRLLEAPLRAVVEVAGAHRHLAGPVEQPGAAEVVLGKRARLREVPLGLTRGAERFGPLGGAHEERPGAFAHAVGVIFREVAADRGPASELAAGLAENVNVRSGDSASKRSADGAEVDRRAYILNSSAAIGSMAGQMTFSSTPAHTCCSSRTDPFSRAWPVQSRWQRGPRGQRCSSASSWSRSNAARR